MRRMLLLAVAILMLATTATPAVAVTDEELYDLRLELQGALGELETASWDRRIAADTIGLVQFEYDELAVDAETAVEDYGALVDRAADRSLVLFAGGREVSWSERAIGHRYLEASLAVDAGRIAAQSEVVMQLDADLDYLAGEVVAFVEAEAEAAARIAELELAVAALDDRYTTMAAEYEAEVQYNATTTTTTIVPVTTTTRPPVTTTTKPPPTTTTTTTTRLDHHNHSWHRNHHHDDYSGHHHNHRCPTDHHHDRSPDPGGWAGVPGAGSPSLPGHLGGAAVGWPDPQRRRHDGRPGHAAGCHRSRDRRTALERRARGHHRVAAR